VREVFQGLGLATAAELSTDNKTDRELARKWMAFLDAAAEKGLAQLAPPGTGTGAPSGEPDPLQLLARLHELLKDELLAHPARKTIERAIENFADHPAIAAVLAQFE
jgi:hypothetical protein